jgi:DNA-binding protein H-NS
VKVILDFKKVSQRKRSLVVQLRELTEAELATFDNNVKEAMEIVLAEKADNAKKEAERNAKKEEIMKMMKDEGMSFQDFTELDKTKTKNKRSPVPPKYSINVDGKVITWTGRGIAPKAFAEHKTNNTMDQFAI